MSRRCHSLLLFVLLLYFSQLPPGARRSTAVQVQPRNGEAIPMSRITVIILALAALGMATLSVLCHLPDESGEPVVPGREEGHRATGLAPLIISLTATPPSKPCCQSSNPSKGRDRASSCRSAPHSYICAVPLTYALCVSYAIGNLDDQHSNERTVAGS